MRSVLASGIAVSVMLAACSPEAVVSPEEEQEPLACTEPSSVPSFDQVERVFFAHINEWMRIPGVVGGGIGKCNGSPCIRVHVAEDKPDLHAAIPDCVDGVRVMVVVTGLIYPLQGSEAESRLGFRTP